MPKSILLHFVFLTSILLSVSAQNKGSFTITTNPSYAYIRLVEFPDIEKKSPAEFIEYRALKYQIQISKHNYHTLDTVITCHPDSISKYHFNLVPKTGSLSITTLPAHANVYFNNQAIGVTPLENFPVPCGANTIRIVSTGLGEFSNTYVINEDMPLSIVKDFSTSTNHNNISYSSPINTGFYEEEETEEPVAINKKAGFGNLGFFVMIGSNGAKGTSWRYGADLFHYIRVFGEQNKQAGISGVGLDFILPADLQDVAFFGKIGAVARSFDYDYSSSLSIQFVTVGGGLSIKPSPHFQIFAEFEVGIYDDEQAPEDIQVWKDHFSDYSTFNGWLGIRVAL